MGKRILIVGSGIAGDEAAFAARKSDPGADVVLATRDPYPLYSACVLADFISGEIGRDRVFLKKEEDYDRAGIRLLLSTEMSRWDAKKQIVQLNREEFCYDRMIIATGSNPFVPPLPGRDLKGVYSLKSFKDADLIRNSPGGSAVVVGSGPVGIEAAMALRKRGFSVTLIELLDRILPSLFDRPVSESITGILKGRGVEVRTGERVLELIGSGNVEKIRTDKGDIECHLAVIVAGMRPEVSMAKAAGLNIGESGGIYVKNTMESSVPGVWACGDCIESMDRISGKTGVFMLWNNARLQGRIAGANSTGGNLEYPGSMNVTTVNVFGMGAAAVGALAGNFSPDEVKVVHRRGYRGEVWLVFRDGRIIGAQAIGRLETLGGLLKNFFNGGVLRSYAPGDERRMTDNWGLRGLRKELHNVLGR